MSAVVAKKVIEVILEIKGEIWLERWFKMMGGEKLAF